MAREKNTRKLHFKPYFKTFIPKGSTPKGIATLLHEEIEAIYLMDILNLYQEEAAKKMEISRPTFTRILKNARQKVALGLISGYTIEIEDLKDELIIAFCSNNKTKYKIIDPIQQYILIYSFHKNKITFIQSLDNPVFNEKLKPAVALPKILIENNVNIFISSKVGEGLKHSLTSKGIKVQIQKNIDLKNLSENFA